MPYLHHSDRNFLLQRGGRMIPPPLRARRPRDPVANACSSMSHNITFTPTCDSAVAIPNPMPDAAPVTKAVRPVRSCMCVFPSILQLADTYLGSLSLSSFGSRASTRLNHGRIIWMRRAACHARFGSNSTKLKMSILGPILGTSRPTTVAARLY
jgi:hypothetical protein